MSKYLYNTTESDLSFVGKTLPAEDYYLIPANLELKFSITSEILSALSEGDLIISRSADSSGHITDLSSAVDYLKENLPKLVDSTNYPFAAKTLPDGKKLYQRIHGFSATVSGTPDNITFTVPYPTCKITEIEILEGNTGDIVNFKVLDDTSGTYSGVPNYVLNQFGFSVNIAEKFYSRKSNYDADLYYGMQVRLEYDSTASDLLPKTVYINLILHEVKD